MLIIKSDTAWCKIFILNFNINFHLDLVFRNCFIFFQKVLLRQKYILRQSHDHTLIQIPDRDFNTRFFDSPVLRPSSFVPSLVPSLTRSSRPVWISYYRINQVWGTKDRTKDGTGLYYWKMLKSRCGICISSFIRSLNSLEI